jgi:hypothetical protein
VAPLPHRHTARDALRAALALRRSHRLRLCRGQPHLGRLRIPTRAATAARAQAPRAAARAFVNSLVAHGSGPTLRSLRPRNWRQRRALAGRGAASAARGPGGVGQLSSPYGVAVAASSEDAFSAVASNHTIKGLRCLPSGERERHALALQRALGDAHADGARPRGHPRARARLGRR